MYVIPKTFFQFGHSFVVPKTLFNRQMPTG